MSDHNDFDLGRFVRDYRTGRLATLDQEVQRLRHMVADGKLTPELWVDLGRAIAAFRADTAQPVLDLMIYLLADIGYLWLELNDFRDFANDNATPDEL
jgi:hypothetical protein